MRIVFVGPSVPEISDDLGFYHLGPKNQFWKMLEYSRITPAMVISEADRHALVGAKEAHLLDDLYRQFFFEKKESVLVKLRIGMTDLNRRKVVHKEDEPGAEPTADDIRKFVKKMEKYRPKVIAFVMNVDLFEKCLRQHYPAATRQRGKQDFMIGNSEVWLIGSTSGRGKETDAMEQVFEDLADRLKEVE